MGLQSRSQSSGSTKYLSISKGNFVQTVTANTEGAIERTNKLGATVYELHFDNDFYGVLTDVRISPNGYDGKDEIRMSFVDSDHVRWAIQFGLRSSYGRRFMSTFWNIDVKEEVVISPYYFIPKGGRDYLTGMNIFQNGVKVTPFYTNEEPGQVPPLAYVMVKGEQQIDDTDRVNYLKQLFEYWRNMNFPEQVAREAEYAASQNQQYSRPAPQQAPQPANNGPVAPSAQTVRAAMPPAPPIPPVPPIPATTIKPSAFGERGVVGTAVTQAPPVALDYPVRPSAAFAGTPPEPFAAFAGIPPRPAAFNPPAPPVNQEEETEDDLPF